MVVGSELVAARLEVHAVRQLVTCLTNGWKPYTQRKLESVRFVVRSCAVDGRGRAVYLKTDLTQSVSKRQILTTPGWTPPAKLSEWLVGCMVGMHVVLRPERV